MSTESPAGAFGDTIGGGGGADRLAGEGGNDRLDGGDGNDILRGGAGNDTLTHDSGQDQLYGDAGADSLVVGFDEDALLPYRVTLDGGSGRDVVAFTSITLGGVVDLMNQRQNDGLAYGKVLCHVEVLEGTSLDDSFAGSNRGDTLRGDSGDDALSGPGGADRLAGGGGSDSLHGGAGRDVFDFSDYGSGWMADTVLDFARGQDRLLFDRSDFGDGALRLATSKGAAAPTAQPTLIFERDAHRLWFDGDGRGDAEGPDLLMTLDGVRTLTFDDFAFI